MKKFYTLISAVILSASLQAQAPQKMSYQSVIRGTNNALVIEKLVGVRVSIIQGSEFGASVYVETHNPTTNTNGLASLSIGTGKILTGEFSKIDWSKGPYFVKTETDIEGGNNYLLTSVSELMSVPYALYAANSQPGPKGDKGDIGSEGPQGPKGDIGLTGPQGEKGQSGVQGLKGDKGDVGAQGPIGLTGPQGLKGDKGDVGAQGPIGLTGPQGLKGDKGDVGAQGPIGPSKDEQKLSVSSSGDTLYLQNGGFVIIPGLSAANPKSKPTSGYGPNISDIDGNNYKTVYIGTQQWMAENLKVSKYSDGVAIPNVTGNTEWSNLTTGAWSYYNNDIINNLTYGKLYNWYVTNPTTNGNKNICPTGWHVPTEIEWNTLANYLGGSSIAGSKMKEKGTTHWSSPNSDANNESNFTALPGGTKYPSGIFKDFGTWGTWWSSNNSRYVDLNCGNGNFSFRSNDVKYGFAIRCLKD